jgi:hypothetical protein
MVLIHSLWLFISSNKAEPKLLEYVYRVKQDVPFEADVVKFEKMKARDEDAIGDRELSTVTFDKNRTNIPKGEVNLNGFDDDFVVEIPAFYATNEVVEKFFD